ncbi:protein prenyltransferase alpha subunit repeat-containing protein 1 [Aricia agestis]|uniref:protein prenyltransferase alpha subunit repeat-containing protein 1 n=1 Tax=Aricia agestis TaxID=91739 RepID=UPI001C2015BD|nr:protein prenyltransferase alpha subunit repeat-containing protein 1 [Aricia agestis]XP_041980889.1 protein prenyltransferase alpha subunit repeat-containing protein 1 [Aricia agestis]
MEDDKFALVEKIIKDINNVLSKSPDVYTFDIIPLDNNQQNKSPVLFLENCLGLESWCVKHVYMYCYSELIDKFCYKQKRHAKKFSTINSDRLVRLLNVILLLNPDIGTFWNKRRDIVQDMLLDKIYELHYSRLILSRKPKCNDAFAYRRWILDKIFQDESVSNIDSLVNDELNICELASDKCPNNYHSYCHRKWLVNNLKTVPKYTNMDSLYVKEYNFSERSTSKHVSDYSCFHYRQFCVKNILHLTSSSWKTLKSSLDIDLRKVMVRILAANFPKDTTVQASEENLIAYSEENLMNLLLAYTHRNCYCVVDFVHLCRKLEILFYELSINNELICFYKHHETLWYHRRFILHEIIVVMYDHFGLVRHNGALVKKMCKMCNNIDIRQKQNKIVRYDSNRIYSSVLFQAVITHEIRFINDRRDDGDNYADRHQKYLKFVEGLNSVL